MKRHLHGDNTETLQAIYLASAAMIVGMIAAVVFGVIR
jgi:hypothetical protein